MADLFSNGLKDNLMAIVVNSIVNAETISQAETDFPCRAKVYRALERFTILCFDIRLEC